MGVDRERDEDDRLGEREGADRDEEEREGVDRDRDGVLREGVDRLGEREGMVREGVDRDRDGVLREGMDRLGEREGLVREGLVREGRELRDGMLREGLRLGARDGVAREGDDGRETLRDGAWLRLGAAPQPVLGVEARVALLVLAGREVVWPQLGARGERLRGGARNVASREGVNVVAVRLGERGALGREGGSMTVILWPEALVYSVRLGARAG